MLEDLNVDEQQEGLKPVRVLGTNGEEAVKEEKDQYCNGKKILPQPQEEEKEEEEEESKNQNQIQRHREEVELEVNRSDDDDEIQEEVGAASVFASASASAYVFSIAPVVSSRYTRPFSTLEIMASKASTGSTYCMGDFTFQDPDKNLLFMLSSRTHKTRNHRVLLNPAAVPLLSAHRKARSLYDQWDVFRGEVPKAEEALFSVRRSAIFQLKKSFHVFLASSQKQGNSPQFKVKGNYLKRNCRILYGSQIIAEANIARTYLAFV